MPSLRKETRLWGYSMNPLYFRASHKFDVTLNALLKNLAEFCQWDSIRQRYEYVFPLSNLPAVEALIGAVGFGEDQAKTVTEHSTLTETEVEVEGWKGKSGFHVTEFPDTYVVTEHQKSHRGATPKTVTHRVPKERVLKVWRELFQELPEHEYFAYKYLAPKVCRIFKLERYFRENKSFMGHKFQGTRTSNDYGKFYYMPMKVLEYYGAIVRRGQWLARAKVDWGAQLELINGHFLTEEQK